MSNYLKSHTCGELRIENLEKTVSLSGWVHRRRDHGGLIFIDLRDHGGLTQLVFDPNINKEVHTLAQKLRSEWVINIKGKVISSLYMLTLIKNGVTLMLNIPYN